jgi:ketosteroid isomerase-like protein
MNPSRRFLSSSILFTALFIVPVIVNAANAASRSEEALRKADAAWETVFSAGKLDPSVDACTATARVLAPNAPLAHGHDEIRKLFAGFFSLPGLVVTWHADEVHVAESGELGYTTGSYEMSFKGPDGKPIADHGKYSTVWQKQKDGRWKVVVDSFNSDVPMPSPQS